MMISCVIPAYEQRDLFMRCLTSACAQTGVDLEVVVTDDSGSDAIRTPTLDLAGTFPFIRYVEGPRTGNPVDNWNHGLDQARGVLLVLAHQDEYFIDPNYLGRAVAAMADPDVAGVLARTTVTGVSRPSRFGLVAPIARRLPRPLWWLPVVNWIGPTAAVVFRPPHRFDRSLVQLADVEFYGRVLTGRSRVMLQGVCIGSLGHHADQITTAIDPIAVAREELRALAARTPPAIGRAQHVLSHLATFLRSQGA